MSAVLTPRESAFVAMTITENDSVKEITSKDYCDHCATRDIRKIDVLPNEVVFSFTDGTRITVMTYETYPPEFFLTTPAN